MALNDTSPVAVVVVPPTPTANPVAALAENAALETVPNFKPVVLASVICTSPPALKVTALLLKSLLVLVKVIALLAAAVVEVLLLVKLLTYSHDIDCATLRERTIDFATCTGDDRQWYR